GTHYGIISGELFNAAGKKLQERRTAKLARYGPMWPLKGKLEYGSCGRLLSPHNTRKGNKVYRYYRAERRREVGRHAATRSQLAASRTQLPIAFRTAAEMIW